jgi:ankyrin repeat protein
MPRLDNSSYTILTNLLKKSTLSQRDIHGNTLLHIIIASGELDDNKYLIQVPPQMAVKQVNIQNNKGNTPLFEVIRSQKM